MSTIDQQKAAFGNKKVVIFDISGEVNVYSTAQCILHKWTSRAATKGHFLDLSTRQCRMTQAWRANRFGNKSKKISFFHRNVKLAYHASTAKIGFSGRRLQKMQVLQSQTVGQHTTHAQVAVIQIGMHGNDGNVMLDSFHNDALDKGLRRDMLQPMENQRVVADNEVAMFGYSFVKQLFGHIQGNQGLVRLGVKVADLQASVVVIFLPVQWGNLGDAIQNVFYGHNSLLTRDFGTTGRGTVSRRVSRSLVSNIFRNWP